MMNHRQQRRLTQQLNTHYRVNLKSTVKDAIKPDADLSEAIIRGLEICKQSESHYNS